VLEPKRIRSELDQREATKRFYDLVWPHRSDVLRVAQILARDRHDAEDLAQETLLKAFKAIDQFAAGTDAKKWLLSILRNCRIDRLRLKASSARLVSLEQLAVEPADQSIEETSDKGTNPQDVLSHFSDQQMIDALQMLPEEIRWTILLVDVEEMGHAEAAGLLDVPEGTIKSRTHRGRAMLRQLLMSMAKELRLVRK